MTLHNSVLVDSERGIFSVCSFATVTLPNFGAWKGEDIDGPEAVGAVFHAFEEESMHEGGSSDASILIADVTNDSSEPYIPSLTEADVPALDAALQVNMEAQMLSNGDQLIRWMHSQLNQSGKWNSLVTPYIILDGGRERQYIMLRTGTANRKFVAIGMFDIAKKERLAASIFNLMRGIEFNVAN